MSILLGAHARMLLILISNVLNYYNSLKIMIMVKRKICRFDCNVGVDVVFKN
jgi:hypothetical protein